MKIKTTFLKRSGLAAGIICVAMLLSGCFGGHERVTYEPRDEVIVPPFFLTGATGLLLTNSSGFSAQVSAELTMPAKKSRMISGLLLGQGSHLLFSPTGGDRTFIWDVSERTGWIFSEALQGYAPISSPEQFTKVTVISESAGPTSERVNGQPGHEAEIAVSSSTGSDVKFNVWRARDLNGLPVRIKVLDPQHLATLQMTSARKETLSPKLFLPPADFAKYASAESIADEIYLRKSKIQNVPGTTITPSERPVQSPTRGY